jgi:hypothetical protein
MLLAAVASVAWAVRAWRTLDPAAPRAWAIACMLPLVYSPHLHVHALTLAVMAFVLYARASCDAGASAPSAARTVSLLGLVTLLWIVSVAGLSLLALPTIGGFVLCVTRWPDAGRAAATDAPQAARLAA